MPAPTLTSPAFIYSPSTTGANATHGLGSVVALPNGRFAALTFADRFDHQTLESVVQTSFWSYDSLTPLTSSRILQDIPYVGLRALPEIAALEDGRLMVWWGVQTGSGANFAVEFYSRLMDSDGDGLGEPVLLGDFSTAGHTFVSLASGGYVMGFEKYTPGGGWDCYVRVYDAAGVAGPDLLVNGTTTDTQGTLRIVQMDNGNLFAVWRSPYQTVPGGETGAIVGRILNPDGSAAGAEFVVNTTAETTLNLYQVTLLGSGNILVVWTFPREEGGETRDDSLARIFTPQGVAVGSEFSLAQDADGVESAPVVLALPQGGFVALWLDDPDGYTGSENDAPATIRGQMYTDAGTPVDSEFQVSPDGLNISSTFTAAVLEDGRFVVSYSLINGYGTEDTWAQIVDPRSQAIDLTGGSLAEDFTGTAYDDRIIGDSGNDSLYGGDGTDTLNGGEGDDYLYGGTTDADLRDVTYGGDGQDHLDGGAGNDEQNGGEGHDTVLGGLGVDTLIGNAGDDLIGGMGGADILSGNAGNDTLNGGFGYDQLNGGAGADVFLHAGVADHASDWIQDYNAADGDLLALTLAGATRNQLQVNFATTPGAGSAEVTEAFVIYRPTGQILWALVDGGDDSSINVRIAGQVYDLLA